MSESLFNNVPAEDMEGIDSHLETDYEDEMSMEDAYISDFSDDAEWFASAGMGTDEDYGPELYNDDGWDM
jgi:hypothetical protein